MNLNINKIKRIISYRLRKKISQKIVIFESDDWGLERAKDYESLQKIIDKYSIEKISRWTCDAIESIDDLDLIFNLFDSYRYKFLNSPIITANFITHNIDYSSKDKLIFKPISEGYNFADMAIFSKYKEGIDKGYFKPQLHGFSHFNTELLKNDFHSIDFKDDFELGFPLAKSTIKDSLGLYRAECFDPNFNDNFKKATAVFEETFGYKSETFIPPNYLYNFKRNKFLYNQGIKLLQSGSQVQNENGKNEIAPNFRSKNGVISSVRNSRLDTHKDYNYLHKNCIDKIEYCFSKNIPAVVDIHRVNFSGKFSRETRQSTIMELDKVLLHLSINHPDTIFMSSDELVRLFKK